MSSRLQEGLDVEDYLYEYMAKQGIGYHIRLGDLFHVKNSVDSVTYSEVANRIARNTSAHIQEILFHGNHDEAAGGVRSTLEALGHIPKVTLIREPSNFVIGDINFIALPHVGARLSLREHAALLTQRVKPSKINVFLGHLGIRGAKTGSEFILPEYLTTDELHTEAYDLGFLGHIHHPQQLTESFMYIGSLLQRTRSDMGPARRAIHFKEDGTFTEIPLPGPKFLNLTVGNISNDIRNISPEGYYKVTLTNADITTTALREAIEGRCRGWTAEYHIPTTITEGFPTTHTWLDAIQTWIDRNGEGLSERCLAAIKTHIEEISERVGRG